MTRTHRKHTEWHWLDPDQTQRSKATHYNTHTYTRETSKEVGKEFHAVTYTTIE